SEAWSSTTRTRITGRGGRRSREARATDRPRAAGRSRGKGEAEPGSAERAGVGAEDPGRIPARDPGPVVADADRTARPREDFDLRGARLEGVPQQVAKDALDQSGLELYGRELADGDPGGAGAEPTQATAWSTIPS